ncbi:hypothetical protein [Lederbergia ruris]|uniref:hypothetical protein n=1 Tax=Lederbergia ruris TaxID=217495 RepID=UPI0039A13053
MNIWNLKHGDKEFNLDIGDSTILVDQSVIWYELVRLIDDYFNNRHTEVQLEEGTTAIQKKDWNCYLIPYDAHLQMDKVTAKSPLNTIINACVEKLSMSPIFFELKDVWSELQEEVYFVNESLSQYDVVATVEDIEEKDLKSFISLRSKKSIMTPIEYKLLLLRLINEKSMSKRTLIILEMPELFADKENMENLVKTVNEMVNKGVRFIIVTSNTSMNGRKNYCIENQIFNEVSIELVKRKVLMDAPFGLEETDFDETKKKIFESVDNSLEKGNFRGNYIQNPDLHRVLKYMVFRNLNISQPIDTDGLPENIVEFIHDY